MLNAISNRTRNFSSNGFSHRNRINTFSGHRFFSNRPEEIISNLNQNGYSIINKNFYINDSQIQAINNAQNNYNFLEKDPSHGNRYRAYARYMWDINLNMPIRSENNDYSQSPIYNEADGGKVRKFKSIDIEYINNPAIQMLINKDIEIAKNTSIIKFTDDLEIGLHQIRYSASYQSPAYSSPTWLHKDDETLVFVHLLNVSPNLIGGDNVISIDRKKIENVVRLNNPGETLVVNKKCLHAVTPMGSSNSSISYRDILLVTFFNKHSDDDASKDTMKIAEVTNSSPEFRN